MDPIHIRRMAVASIEQSLCLRVALVACCSAWFAAASVLIEPIAGMPMRHEKRT
jgi:hypothetical protein